MDINTFAVHFQVWKNDEATEFAIKTFREHFPKEPIRLISDNGNDYTNFIKKYNLDFDFSDKNIFPKGRFESIEGCYEWLKRVNDTCLKYNTEWILLFEDDVLTKNSNIVFPNIDSAGLICWSWNYSLDILLKNRNKINSNFGYGMCGGTIFKRQVFIEAYNKINEFDLEYLSQLDHRVILASDCLINCFLQYFGATYDLWDKLEDMTYPGWVENNNACFTHGYKNLYK
jgi:hypothetical protein